MKTMHRLFSAMLAMLLLAGLCVAAIPVTAAAGEGMTFTGDDLYRPVKKYDTTPNTYEAWIKLPAGYTDRGGVILGSYSDKGPNQINFEIYSNGQPRLFWSNSKNVAYSDAIFTSVNVCTGDWVHLTITRDVSEGKLHCYLNGEWKQSINLPEILAENVIPDQVMCPGGDLRNGNAQYFKGAIRSVVMFSDMRTAEEIAADKDRASFVGQDGLMVHYDMANHTAKTAIADLSGNGHHASYVNNERWIDPADKAPVTDYAYSFAVVGDTQIVNKNYPEKFEGIYRYIVENIESKNIKFVFGLGDITDADSDAEWQRAYNALHSLDGKVGYSIVRGNHDSDSKLNKTFPYSDYKDVLGGSYDGTMNNTYQTLQIGEIKYLIITLDYGASIPVLRWAGKLCEEYADHNVIITTHAYMYRNGTTLDKDEVCPPIGSGGYNNGDHIWEMLITEHENIVLVLSGHDPCDQIVVTQEKGEAGNTVTQMLIDPQGADVSISGGVGAVAMLYFSADGRNVTVDYYSTIQQKYFMGANQFTMTLDVVGDRQQNNPSDNKTESGTEENNGAVTNEKPLDTAPSTDAVTDEGVADTAEKNDGGLLGGCFSVTSAGVGTVMALILCAAIPMIRKKEN